MRSYIKSLVFGLLLSVCTVHSVVQAQEREPVEMTDKICQWEARTAEHIRANKFVGIRKMDLQARMGLEIETTVADEKVRKEMQGQILRVIDGVYNNDYVMNLSQGDLLRGFYIYCLQGR